MSGQLSWRKATVCQYLFLCTIFGLRRTSWFPSFGIVLSNLLSWRSGPAAVPWGQIICLWLNAEQICAALPACPADIFFPQWRLVRKYLMSDSVTQRCSRQQSCWVDRDLLLGDICRKVIFFTFVNILRKPKFSRSLWKLPCNSFSL